MNRLLIIAALLLPCLAFGQAPIQTASMELPEAASAIGQPAVTAAVSTDAMLIKPAIPVQPAGVAAAPELHPRLVDKKFMALGSFVFASTAVDMELTQHCLQRGTCHELNPTLPTSHWAMYATNTPVNAAVMYLAYKRRQGGHKDWWIWPMIDTGIHIVGVGSNLRFALGK
jgi:hypothetical protein